MKKKKLKETFMTLRQFPCWSEDMESIYKIGTHEKVKVLGVESGHLKVPVVYFTNKDGDILSASYVEFFENVKEVL